jgi:hypothetical protein
MGKVKTNMTKQKKFLMNKIQKMMYKRAQDKAMVYEESTTPDNMNTPEEQKMANDLGKQLVEFDEKVRPV